MFNKVKLAILSLLLQPLVLCAYTNEIVTYKKGSKRLILVGGFHEEKPSVVPAQEKFFGHLIKKFNEAKEQNIKVFYESIENPKNPFSRKKLTPGSHALKIFNAIQNIDGKTLASLRFASDERKFAVENFDLRTEADMEVMVTSETITEHFKIHQAKKAMKYEELRKIGIQEETLKSFQEHLERLLSSKGTGRTLQEKVDIIAQQIDEIMQFTTDLNFIKLLTKQEDAFSIFMAVAGNDHIQSFKVFLPLMGWEVINDSNSENPSNWTTKDPVLTQFFLDKNTMCFGSGCCNTSKKNSQDPLMKCSRCKIAQYCSAECQKNDWKKHKSECLPKK